MSEETTDEYGPTRCQETHPRGGGQCVRPAGHPSGHTVWLNGMPVAWARAGEAYCVCMACQWDGYAPIGSACPRCGEVFDDEDDEEDTEVQP